VGEEKRLLVGDTERVPLIAWKSRKAGGKRPLDDDASVFARSPWPGERRDMRTAQPDEEYFAVNSPSSREGKEARTARPDREVRM
jgi:hypothetical protein